MAPPIHDLAPPVWVPAVFCFKHLLRLGLGSVHSLCRFALKVLALCVSSSSRSRLPGSATVSQQLCFNTRPPGSEFTPWLTQHPSVLLAGILKHGGEDCWDGQRREKQTFFASVDLQSGVVATAEQLVGNDLRNLGAHLPATLHLPLCNQNAPQDGGTPPTYSWRPAHIHNQLILM